MKRAHVAALVLIPVALSSGYSVRGRIKGPHRMAMSGVTLNFKRVKGPGAVPESVTTNAKGRWKQRGFEVGTTYKVIPTLSGYEFTPKSKKVSKGGSATFRAAIDPTSLLWVQIPGGSFDMGCTEGDDACEPRELPVHTVDVPTFEVMGTMATNAQYRACMDAGKCSEVDFDQTAEFYGEEVLGDAYPIINVSDKQAKAFCKWAGRQGTGREGAAARRAKGRLPSEAEWEYAARGGRNDWRYPWGDGISHKRANYVGTLGKDKWSVTSPVGSFPANAYGLYDMAGNAWEWVQDAYHDSYDGAPTDGSAWTSDPGDPPARVLRGGSWNDQPETERVSKRGNGLFGDHLGNAGFRCARNVAS